MRRAAFIIFVALTSCRADSGGHERLHIPPARPASNAPRHEVTIAIPASLKGVHTGEVNAMGEAVVVPCATCHAGQSDAGLPQADEALGGPHAGFSFSHGELPCGSCHDAEQRDKLRLADGTRIELVEALKLCGQCHGPQRRDYAHGAHGGVRGYWDTTRGPRVRNHCVSCHDPHRPKYPKLIPAAPPRDRLLPKGGKHG